jgi:acylphosphatase
MRDTNTPPIAVRARIYGRVQGVWYRGWTVATASDLGLAGWVRNRRDGSVEALFVGPPDVIETMLAQCRKGPPTARVDEVVQEIEKGESLGEIIAAGFRQLPTL